MDKAISDSVAVLLRSAFPEGTFTQVDVLGYGDDPDVEPGETAIRAFVDRAGRPVAYGHLPRSGQPALSAAVAISTGLPHRNRG